jgi:hypothetical protein
MGKSVIPTSSLVHRRWGEAGQDHGVCLHPFWAVFGVEVRRSSQSSSSLSVRRWWEEDAVFCSMRWQRKEPDGGVKCTASGCLRWCSTWLPSRMHWVSAHDSWWRSSEATKETVAWHGRSHLKGGGATLERSHVHACDGRNCSRRRHTAVVPTTVRRQRSKLGAAGKWPGWGWHVGLDGI